MGTSNQLAESGFVPAYGVVTAKFVTHQRAAGSEADGVPVQGRVVFTPTTRVADAGTRRVFVPAPVTGWLRDGVLWDAPRGGNQGVRLMAPSPGAVPSEWGYRVEAQLRDVAGCAASLPYPSIYVRAGVTLNLAEVAPAGAESTIPAPVPVKGDPGDRGERGEQGPKGDRGERGEAGERGPKGDRGERGERGEQGPKGDRGERGEAGERGPKGDRGERGERGEQGSKGEPGGLDAEATALVQRLASSAAPRDTGWRRVESPAIAAGALFFRRVGDWCIVAARGGAWDTITVHDRPDIKDAAYREMGEKIRLVTTVPPGWQSVQPVLAPVFADNGESRGILMLHSKSDLSRIIWRRGTLDLSPVNRSNLRCGLLIYPASDPFPTTLPGTPA